MNVKRAILATAIALGFVAAALALAVIATSGPLWIGPAIFSVVGVLCLSRIIYMLLSLGEL